MSPNLQCLGVAHGYIYFLDVRQGSIYRRPINGLTRAFYCEAADWPNTEAYQSIAV